MTRVGFIPGHNLTDVNVIFEEIIFEMNYLNLALKNTIVFGDTDIFPIPFEYIYLKDKPELLQNFFSAQGDYSLENSCSLHLETTKNNGEIRTAALIDPLLHLEYLALAIQIAEYAEQSRIPKEKMIVHSYRFAADEEKGKLFDSAYGFHTFRKTMMEKSEAFEDLIASIDIREFYPSISINVLEVILKNLQIPYLIIEKLKRILDAINSNVGKGLPIGGNASRILAELVLNEIDHQLMGRKINYIRFVDDFCIFSQKGNEIKDIEFIRNLLHEKGLQINYNKLKISESRKLNLESDLFMNIPLYNEEIETAVANIEHIILGQLERVRKDKYLNCGLLKLITEEKSINQITWHIADIIGFLHKGFGSYIQWVLDNIDLIHDEVFIKIYNSVSDLVIKKHSVIRTEINLSFAIRLLSVIQDKQTEDLLNDLYIKNQDSQLIKINIIQAFTRWQRIDWVKENLQDIKKLNGWQRRALLMNLKNRSSIIMDTELTPVETLLWCC